MRRAGRDHGAARAGGGMASIPPCQTLYLNNLPDTWKVEGGSGDVPNARVGCAGKELVLKEVL